MATRSARERRSVTMKDVARAAGVSQRTVSNVVNDYVHVSPPTRERVRAAIETLGYRPNAVARSLRDGIARVIALAVPDLTWPYFSEIAHLVQSEARERGYTVVTLETQGDEGVERFVLSVLGNSMIDGIVLSSLGLGGEELNAMNLGIPIVLLGERIHDAGRPHFSIDNVLAAEEMTRHLLQLGARSFLVLGAADTQITRSSGVLRLQGFRCELGRWGLDDSAWTSCAASPWTEEQAWGGIVRLNPDQLPDAVFAMNDLLAIGALRAFADRGISVPERILVSGWDDIGASRMTIPRLTTVSPDKASIAHQAVTTLIDLIEEESPSVRDIVIGHRLIVRGSTDAEFGVVGESNL
ncbi:LacI family DNA-binding transcriptional regulator [Schaalia vaccimaxillae]|uniref:LacI family DNA-binding transcriptional regulator n=1 Tax=Schaalia vaccimaxillae TaxID=183916 RepID=UPI0003B3471A|nr:LacI family DNA-binding transcriptional regulator [Schaalia vaccimaxillae]